MLLFSQNLLNILAKGGVSVDFVGPSSAGAGLTGTTLSPLSFSHNCSGIDRALFVGVAFGAGSLNDSTFAISSVTYNGIALTLVPNSKVSNAGRGFVALYYLVAPPTGTYNVVITSTQSVPNTSDSIEAGSISFTNVDQSMPFQNLASKIGSTGAPNIDVASCMGSVVIDLTASAQPLNLSDKVTAWFLNGNSLSGAGNASMSFASGQATMNTAYRTGTTEWQSVGLSVRAQNLSASSYIKQAMMTFF